MTKNLWGFYVAGMAACDRKIALVTSWTCLTLQRGEMEPYDENPGLACMWSGCHTANMAVITANKPGCSSLKLFARYPRLKFLKIRKSFNMFKF